MEEDQYYTSICSAATLQSDKKGFFQSYADNVLELAGSQWLNEFRQLTSDSERLLKCYNDERLYEVVHGVLHNVQEMFRGKAAQLSQLRRVDGDKAARGGKYERALLLFTQSIIRAPGPGVDKSVDGGLSLSLALWSRASTLWHLSEYQLCLSDLQSSLKQKLPDKFRVEAYWMMAQCYERLKETARARVTLQVILKMLSPEDTEWRDKVTAELKNLANVQNPEPANKENKEGLLDGEHPQLPGLSAALSVRSGEKTGRYVVARQRVSSGDVLAAETPYVACLLPAKFGSHCHHCFMRLRSAVPCMECAGLAFCSPACRDAALSYHRYECRYVDLLIGSGMSILCHIALRTITQQEYSYWQRVREKQPVSPDYTRLANLVTHANKRQPKDFVSRTLMALFLLRILEHSHYIPPTDCDEDDNLTGMRLFLGCVLLHLLQCLQFNAHEIYETMYKKDMDFESSKINYTAVGVYPSVALFNHDCCPPITRYFRGKELVLRAVRPLAPGDAVSENYGPVFTMRTLSERQRSLASRYWFTCECAACQEDWPKLTALDTDIVHLRCKMKDCDGFITTSIEPRKPKAKCPKCGVNLNLAEAALLVKSYHNDYERGLAAMGEGQLTEAAQVFSAYSDVMHVVCRPPIKNVSLAQEALRSCWAYNYNKHVLN
ncbi:SET and MYND domain-containing protein 4-like [Homalodisca vitripennis]|uniref:SET and MYND domain-containing protein 4-like n=1 Tax=Homalodisca vitripennis TaxID=197043 RepID=UPI001EEB6D8B|nr:SET and MYND domain-containing protein 4-like [Homalodisca vitripennis]XP_046669356.1 SET and MYND domain-containing protein 4-like [Homalodisca vitripennis]XP_046669357.1 SET and MYND domain-containing protein 4-like [Homalodisca vitripennis]XP_046669358.1 SET and MYND domain-containing protein 4-like [Homalodisca vitripennis]